MIRTRRKSHRNDPYRHNIVKSVHRQDPFVKKSQNKNPEISRSDKVAYLASNASYGEQKSIDKLKKLGYFIDPEFSNSKVSTFFSEKEKPIVAWRGTRDLLDLRADSTILTGNYNDPTFQHADELFQKVKLKYAVRGTPIATGHSLGGTKAALAGGKHGGEVVVFNPGTGAYKLGVRGRVFRTNNDIISRRVSAESEHISKGGHSLDNFNFLENADV